MEPNRIDDDARGFTRHNEGVPSHLLAKYEALPPKAKLSIETIDGLVINTAYPCNPANYTALEFRYIREIYVHYTGGVGSARANAAYYEDDDAAQASAHFFVGWASEGAQIYRSVPDMCRAWHVIGHNANSIGIEVACHNSIPGEEEDSGSLGWYFDPETVDKLVLLVRALMAKYGIDADHVYRHFDGTGKICPAMWVHDEAAWRAFKARLVPDELHDLAVSVCRKIKSTSADYWEQGLKGIIQVPCGIVKALFEKVCNAAEKTFTTGTLYIVTDSILGISKDIDWLEIIDGTRQATPAYLVPLFKLINKALH